MTLCRSRTIVPSGQVLHGNLTTSRLADPTEEIKRRVLSTHYAAKRHAACFGGHRDLIERDLVRLRVDPERVAVHTTLVTLGVTIGDRDV